MFFIRICYPFFSYNRNLFPCKDSFICRHVSLYSLRLINIIHYFCFLILHVHRSLPSLLLSFVLAMNINDYQLLRNLLKAAFGFSFPSLLLSLCVCFSFIR